MKLTSTSDGSKSQHHKRHPDWEAFDKVTVELEPRLKTSGMSGDEWRTGVSVKLWFKGRPIVEKFYNNWDFAISMIAALMAENSCPIDNKVIAIEKHACDQPSCPETAVSRYQLKKLFSERGEALHPDEGSYADHYRQFCARHLYRGDCSREDCDDNYIVVSGPGPNESQEHPSDESPSSQLMVSIDSMDDLPAAIATAVANRPE